jgi:hypothetical protein
MNTSNDRIPGRLDLNLPGPEALLIVGMDGPRVNFDFFTKSTDVLESSKDEVAKRLAVIVDFSD